MLVWFNKKGCYTHHFSQLLDHACTCECYAWMWHMIPTRTRTQLKGGGDWGLQMHHVSNTPMNNMRKLDKGQAKYKYTRIEVVRMENILNKPRHYISFTNACSQGQKWVLHLETHGHEGNNKDLGFPMFEPVNKLQFFLCRPLQPMEAQLWFLNMEFPQPNDGHANYQKTF